MVRFVEQTLNGLIFSGLLFLLGSGFSLIFGLLRVVNIAHGAAYLLGGYIGYSVVTAGGPFWLGLIAGFASMLIFGFLLEGGLLRRVRGLPMRELLLSLGVALVVGDVALAIWGGQSRAIRMPGILDETSDLGLFPYSNSRLFIAGLSIVIGIILYLVMSRTRIGALIRAGVDDQEVLMTVGVDVNRLFLWVFMVGAGLAGVAGVLGSSFLTLYPGADWDIMTLGVVVVIVGGVGSVEGAMVGSLAVGLSSTYANAYFPDAAYFSIFVPMVLVLLWKPEGLVGRKATL